MAQAKPNALLSAGLGVGSGGQAMGRARPRLVGKRRWSFEKGDSE